ncbi:MAG: hypothetical protein IPK97_09945 [Ahniella sp.]|nr:hypothetical protein [Ahniella sp.]
MRIYNSTFWANKTFQSTESGALLLGGPVRIANSTIVGNSGSTSGGLYLYPSSDTWLVNTIVADNTGTSPDIAGRVYSVGNNLIRSRTGSVIDGNVSSNLYDVSPLVGALANNGGPTHTLALLANSPARNAGSDCVLTFDGCGGVPHLALSTDQRGSGFPRKRGSSVDIGALESSVVTVTNNADSGTGSLRQAVIDAQPFDSISFASPFFDQARTITLSGPLVIAKPLTIAGPGAALLTIDGNNVTRQMNIDAGGQVQLSGARFTRGNPGAGIGAGSILINGGVLNASDIEISQGTSQQGGCLYNNGTLTLQRAVLRQCQANFAAAFFNENGRTASLTDVRIESSISSGPGGGIGSFGTLNLIRTSVSGNQATYGAGLLNYGVATLANVTLSGNSASQAGGGGAYLGLNSTTTLSHTTITDNSSVLIGGGITAEGGAVIQLRNTVIAGNSAGSGAPDVQGMLTSQGYNLIGESAGNSFAAGSDLTGVTVGAPARLAPLADNGGFARTHAPLANSLLDDAGGSSTLMVDARNLSRVVDFSDLANAAGGNGSDIGAYEIQVSTPVNVVAAAATGGVSVSFTGGANGGLAISSYLARCGNQTATGAASPILVVGLPVGSAVTCTVTAFSDALSGIPSMPSNSVTPGEVPGAPIIGLVTAGNGQASVMFTAPASNGGSPITRYNATCGARSASALAAPISVIGLTNGQSVQCVVTATNAIGTGPASATSNSVTPGLPGAFAYIPKVSAASVAVVDLATGSVAANIGVGSGNTGVAVSPDGARVYLVSQNLGQVTVINTQSNAVVGTIAVGPSPWSAVVAPDSAKVYVTNSGNSTVSVIDAATNTVTGTIPVFNNPFGIAITPDGSRVYVTNGGSNAVSVIDTSTQAVVATLTAGMDPIGVAISPDGLRAYVTSQTQNNVTVFDTASHSVLGRIPVGNTAYGVVVGRDSRRVYVGNANGNSVSVIDAVSRTVIATVPVGSRPEGIDVSPDGSRCTWSTGTAARSVRSIPVPIRCWAKSISVAGPPFVMGRFVAVGGIAPVFTSNPPPNGVIGTPYTHTLVTSGTPGASFVLESGNLPPGLSLNGQVISGTPTALGTSTGQLRATNGLPGAASQAFSIQIVRGTTGPGNNHFGHTG